MSARVRNIPRYQNHTAITNDNLEQLDQQNRIQYNTRSASRNRSNSRLHSNVNLRERFASTPVVDNIVDNIDLSECRFCDEPLAETTSAKKWPLYFYVIVCIGFLAIATRFVINEYTGSNAFIENLNGITDQMNAVQKDLQNLMETEDITDAKLIAIENLLKELKNAQENCTSVHMQLREKERIAMAFQEIVKKVLDKYDADKTGKTDFALESLGGRIVNVRDTPKYNPGGSEYNFLGVPICDSTNDPQSMIQASVLPGECWAFRGSSGTAVIKLVREVVINEVTLEHISKNLSPSGEISTAPKEFSIWGLEDHVNSEGEFLGTFTYDANGPSLQNFLIESDGKAYKFVEFKVHTNHGHPNFTCVYRLRVHGTLN